MYEQIKSRIAEIGKLLEEYGLNVGSSGNISVRILEKNHIVITPSGLIKSKLKPEDMLVVDIEGEIIEGERNPSIEMPLHLEIYKHRKDVNAIIHCHPIYAMVFAALREDIPIFLEETAIYLGGPIKVAEFARTGTEELAQNALKALGDRKAVILANHGLVAVGRDLDDAFEVAYRVERTAKIYLFTKLLGGPKSIPEDIIEEELEIYKIKNELD